MGWKILTNVIELAERYGTAELMVEGSYQQRQISYRLFQQQGIQILLYRTPPTLNVQRLLMYIRILDATKLLPFIKPEEALRLTTPFWTLTEEEENAKRKRILPIRKLETLELERIERLRTEELKQQVRRIFLTRNSINLIDHRSFCQLEKYLWLNYPLQVIQILGMLLQQSTAKQWFLQRITGLEALEKLMLQMYMYAFMEFPEQLNMLGLRVTPLTMQVLRYRPASIYETEAIEGQVIKQSALMMNAMARKLETKKIAIQKPRQLKIPRKENIAVTESITEESEVSVGKDSHNKDMFFTMLRYCYSMPFWLRRWFARSMGMPENHKYARYFGIGCIPTRRGRFSWKRRRYDEYSAFLYSRDEQVSRYIAWRELHGLGEPYSGRYGGYRVWRKAMKPPYYTVP